MRVQNSRKTGRGGRPEKSPDRVGTIRKKEKTKGNTGVGKGHAHGQKDETDKIRGGKKPGRSDRESLEKVGELLTPSPGEGRTYTLHGWR